MDIHENNFIICGNQYIFECPGALLQQRMIGSCYKKSTVGADSIILTSPCPTACPTALIADIIFILDESGSVDVNEFQSSLNWMKQVLQSFKSDIDIGNVHVGVLTFATNPSRRIQLSAFTYDDLSSLISRIFKNSGNTYIGKAINAAIQELSNYGRPNVPQQLILLTDGYPAVPDNVLPAANSARNAGITTVAVGVGSSVLNITLEEIAGSKKHIFFANNFDNLGSVVEGLRNVINESAQVILEGQISNASNILVQCQQGMATHLSNKNNLYVGASGAYDRAGSVVDYISHGEEFSIQYTDVLNDTELKTFIGPDDFSTLKESYLGYSVTSGNFFGGSVEYIASGLPRFHSKGAVLIYKPNHPITTSSDYILLHPHEKNSLWQIGAYFGQALCNIDVNKDFFDDLLISAPLFSETTGYDQGKVFVFMNHPSKSGSERWISSDYQPLVLHGSKVSGARFGMAIVNGGDIDQNGYDDVIVGAPMEHASESDSGAVYIYFSSSSGITNSHKQRILGKGIGSSLKNFGQSILSSRNTNTDIDGNGYPDAVVAAPSSDTIILLRSRPIVNVSAAIIIETNAIDIMWCVSHSKYTCTTLKICLKAESRKESARNSFEMDFVLSLDSLITDAGYQRFIFREMPMSSTKTFKQIVTNTKNCTTYDILLNPNTFSSYLGGGLFDIAPTVHLAYDLSQPHKDSLLSAVLDPFISKHVSAEWLLLKGCSGLNERCEHDLVLSAAPIISSTQPHIIETTPGVFSINVFVNNVGPDHSYFTKVNVSSGTLPLVQVHGNCVTHSIVESYAGITVFHLKSSSVISNLMASGQSCSFQLDFSLLALAASASESQIKINGIVYSHAGSRNVTYDTNIANNCFKIEREVRYSSHISVEGSSIPESIFYNQSLTTNVVHTLMDPALGGNHTNIIHKHNFNNVGPNLVSQATITFVWPSSTIEGFPLLYIYNFLCMPTSVCKCETTGKINTLHLPVLNDVMVNVSLLYPAPGSIQLPSQTTCSNVKCDVITCSVYNLSEFATLTVTSSFKLWLPTLFKDNLVVSSVVDVNTSSSPLHPPNTIYRTSVSTSVLAFIPPGSNTIITQTNITAIIGGLLGGIALLCILTVGMWKAGFFTSKYAVMKKDATKLENTSEVKLGNVEFNRSSANLIE